MVCGVLWIMFFFFFFLKKLHGQGLPMMDVGYAVNSDRKQIVVALLRNELIYNTSDAICSCPQICVMLLCSSPSLCSLFPVL